MAQLNMNVTPAFGRALAQFMRLRKIESKSEAIRVAVDEALAAEKRKAAEEIVNAERIRKIKALYGAGLRHGPLNPNPKFRNDDEIWMSDAEIERSRAAEKAKEG